MKDNFKEKKPRREGNDEIDLLPLFKAAISKWWLIVIFAVVFGLVSSFPQFSVQRARGV